MANTGIKTAPEAEPNYDPYDTHNDIWTTWKARMKKGKESIAKNCIDYILYHLPDTSQEKGQAGLRVHSILDLFKEEDIGQQLLPNGNYPSDHVAIAVDMGVVLPLKDVSKS